jgi:hypothetical protein
VRKELVKLCKKCSVNFGLDGVRSGPFHGTFTKYLVLEVSKDK